MTKKRTPAFDLDVALEDPGFMPRASDVASLLDRIAGKTPSAELATRALLRLGEPGARAAAERAELAQGPERARLVEIVARAVALAGPEAAPPGLVSFLCERLRDADARARRYAAVGLGKLRMTSPGASDVATALAEALAREDDAPARRALVAALGKVGGATALAALAGAESAEVSLADEQARSKAQLMAERTLGRAAESAFDPAIATAGSARVVLRCRAGLEPILAGELGTALEPIVPSDGWGPGRVEVTLRGAPAQLFEARTWMSFGFALDDVEKKDGSLEAAILRALTSPAAVGILKHHTRGAIRYRIAWASGGKRRALVWRIAAAVAGACPELVNDPTASAWEVAIHEGLTRVKIELVPRTIDPRFAYRSGDVPAASHPTIAAALVRVAGPRADDVVWDPFVGSGTELCERALAGPYRSLIGTDYDASALEVARKNLTAALSPGGLENVELIHTDALRFTPDPQPTLIVTNPPMGRRVLRGIDLGALLERVVGHAARVLAPGGRFVWISPLPARTIAAAARAGLTPTLRREVDMGGFSAEMQAFSRVPPHLRPSP